MTSVGRCGVWIGCWSLMACGSPAEGESQSESSSSGPPPTSSSSADDTTSSSSTTMVDPTVEMTTIPDPECGNSVIEPPEQCDPPGDGCDVDCTALVDTNLWEVVHAGDAGVAESGQGITTDAAGNVYVVGFEVDTVGDPNVWLAKYDPDGSEQFQFSYDPSGGGDDRAYGVALDSADNIVIIGDIGVGPSDSDIWIRKVDPAGAEMWTVTVPGPSAGADVGNAVTVDSADNVVVCGYVRIANNDNDIWLGKYTAGGAEDWTDTVPGPEDLDDRCEGITVDADDNILAVGFVSKAGFNRDVWLRKLSPTGATTWTREEDTVNRGSESGFGVAVGPDARIGVAGTTPVLADNDDVWLGVIDPETGELDYQRDFGGPATIDDHGLGIAIDSDNAFIIVGFKGITPTDSDIFMRKWDGAGAIEWTQAVVGAGMDRDQGLAIAVDAMNNIVATGEIRPEASNNGDIWIGKFAPE